MRKKQLQYAEWHSGCHYDCMSTEPGRNDMHPPIQAHTQTHMHTNTNTELYLLFIPFAISGPI